MEQYISKAAIIAEIERLINSHEPLKTLDPTYCEGLNDSLDDILSFLDTIEVKEVDIRSEVSNWWNNYYAGLKKDYTFEGYTGHYFDNSTIVNLAKHFFEVGLNSQRKISYVPNIEDSLKELGVDPDSKEAKIFKESYYTALEKLKAQKGE